MGEVLTKEELLEIINYDSVQYEIKVKFALDYLKQQENAAPIINKLIAHMKSNKNFDVIGISKIFTEEVRNIFYGTGLCPNEISFSRVSNYLMIASKFIELSINLFKQGKMLKEDGAIEEDKSSKKEKVNKSASIENDVNKKNEKPEMTPEKAARLAKQAQAMREAKARKRAESIKNSGLKK